MPKHSPACATSVAPSSTSALSAVTSIWDIKKVVNSGEAKAAVRSVTAHLPTLQVIFISRTFDDFQVRDEHRQDYDAGRGGWGAQAQRLEMERRREVEERYADAQDGPGAVAVGGGDWKEGAGPEQTLKRGRSPDDEGDPIKAVSLFYDHTLLGILKIVFFVQRDNVCAGTNPTSSLRGCSYCMACTRISVFLCMSPQACNLMVTLSTMCVL